MSASRPADHAIVMHEYGPPGVLIYEEVPRLRLSDGDIRIRSIASAVNHTDLEIRSGNWPILKDRPFPYVPGVEVVGAVDAVGEAVCDIHPDDHVITMMQGLGGVRSVRPGGYAKYVTVAADAVAPIPAGVDLLDMAAVGLGGVTAYEGLRRLGPLSGRRIVVTGAAGGVGSAATAIAHAEGASVVGVVSRREQADYVRALGAREVFVASEDLSAALKPGSVDGVLDAVGGNLFGTCVAALRPGGVLSLVGAVAGGQVNFDAYDLIHPVMLTGYSSESLNGETLRQAVTALGDWLRRGAIRPPARQLVPLAEAAKAHALLERKGVQGRILLIP